VPVKLEARRVAIHYRRQRTGDELVAVEAVDLGVSGGEFVSIVGPSGCGKTTFLSVVDGLLPATSGRIFVDGVQVARPGPDRAVVFQDASLLPWRTVLDNVGYGLECNGASRRQAREHAEKFVALVGLQGFEHNYPYELSGGMQQRVNLARALAIDPAILLMDEPFSALDAQTREVLQLELLRVQRETGKTILFVTHDLDEAIYLSNRIVVMGARPGRIKRIMEIPFSYPRKDLPELRGDPEFQEIRRTMWELIRNAPAMAA